jgi:hypothetical protein
MGHRVGLSPRLAQTGVSGGAQPRRAEAILARYNWMVPAGKLTRSQVEDVLRRAAELETERLGTRRVGDGDETDPDSGEGLGELDLLRLGEEVGLSAEAMHDAMGELRAGKALHGGPAGPLDAAFGAHQLIVSRTIPGPPGPITRAVERFLREQLMTVRRHHGERIEWQRARGLWPGLARSLAFARQFAFGPVSRVETRIEPAREGATHVSFRIDLAPWRRDRWLRAAARAITAFTCFGLGGVWLFPGFGVPDVLALLTGGGLAGGLMALERRRFLESREEVAVAPARFLDLLAQRRAKRLPRNPTREADAVRAEGDRADDSDRGGDEPA